MALLLELLLVLLALPPALSASHSGQFAMPIVTVVSSRSFAVEGPAAALASTSELLVTVSKRPPPPNWISRDISDRLLTVAGLRPRSHVCKRATPCVPHHASWWRVSAQALSTLLPGGSVLAL